MSAIPTAAPPGKKKQKLIPRAIFDSPFIPQSLLTTAGESSPVIWDKYNNNTISESWVETNFSNTNINKNMVIGLREVMRSIGKAISECYPDFVLIEKPGNAGSGRPHRMIYDHLLLVCYLRQIPVFLMSSGSASFLAKMYNLKRCSVISPTVSHVTYF